MVHDVWLTCASYLEHRAGRNRTGGDQELTYWTKPFLLAIPPVKGLGIQIQRDLDPYEIRDVWVNRHGAVICDFEAYVAEVNSDPSFGDGLTLQDARDSVEWFFEGWAKLRSSHQIWELKPAPPA
jgi:hypothetical protein